MVRKIVLYPAPVLRHRCEPITEVTPALRQLATDMLETMNEHHGVGLAAPQIGETGQIAVIDVSHNPECVSFFRKNGQDADMMASMPIVFLNPKLELGSDKESNEEGCLSFPDMRGQVRRSEEIKVTYQTLDGDTVTIETDGLLARAFQHEIDHLNGILFIDRFSPTGKLSLKKRLARHMQEWKEDGLV